MFTKKQREILKLLIQLETGTYMTGQTLARILGVSVKTVQKEIKQLKCLSQDFGFIVSASTNKGYRIELIEDGNWLQNYLDDFEMESSTQNSYARDIIHQLLLSSHYIKMQEISDKLFISDSKALKELTTVKEILLKYDLTIDRKPYYGIKIIGNEENIRSLIIRERIPIYELFATSEKRIEAIKELTDIIIQILVDERYLISDVVLENLVLSTYIAIVRVHDNHIIDFSMEVNEMVETYDLQIAKTIAQEVKKKFGEKLPYTEIMYLALFLQAERNHGLERSITTDMENITCQMLAYIKKKMGIDFTSDVDLRISLTMHIHPMMMRAKNNFTIRNAVLNEIITSYPLAYDIALTGSCFLHENYGLKLSPDEVAYLAVYFNLALNSDVENKQRKKVLIISSQRRGDSLMLRHMFMKKFGGRIEKLDIINVIELSTINLQEYDVIFTTTVEFENLPPNITRINYFLSGQDYRIIEERLDGDISCKHFEDFFQEDLLFRGKVSNKEELIKEMVVLAAAKFRNLNPEELYLSVLRREEYGLTCFGKGIAIPHPSELLEDSESFMVVALLNKSVEWTATEKANLVFMICINKDDFKSMKQLFRGLSILLSDENVKNEIITQKNFEALYRYVEKIGENVNTDTLRE